MIAVDVGHGQLAASIADDAGVISIEGFNVRYMTPESLGAASGVDAAPDVVTGDLSFISLAHVLPAASRGRAPDADFVLLVKPQFEVGRTAVKGGLVTDAAAPRRCRRPACSGRRGTWAWARCGVISSPIAGTHGNPSTRASRAGAGGAIRQNG